RLAADETNLRAAIDSGDPETGLGIALALTRYWYIRGLLGEGRKVMARVLARPGAAKPVRVMALFSAGVLAWHESDRAAARALFEESLALHRSQGDHMGTALTLRMLGVVETEAGDFGGARRLLDGALSEFRRLGCEREVASSLNDLGRVEELEGDASAARA